MTKIFCVGSNLAGKHGKGAALKARNKYGAVYGVGVGRSGNAYLIPTKRKGLRIEQHPEDVLSLAEIKGYVNDFIEYAKANPGLTFELTRIGCGLAGYKDSEMAPLFIGVPSNVIVPKEWESFLR